MTSDRKLLLRDVENAFQPSREIDNAERFAGRKRAVDDALRGLLAEGANLAIIGNRGIGKSSLARQVINIASGDNSLLRKLNIAHDAELDFFTAYLACGASTRSVSDLLRSLLTSQTGLGDWIYDIPGARRQLTEFAPELSVKAFGVGGSIGGRRTKEETSEPAVKAHSLETVFTNVLASLAKAKVAKDGILIVVDEFDQVTDPSGFATLLKALATNVPAAKFCVVGVAQDIYRLMKEHESADRLFAGSVISLPSMSPSELSEIIRIGERAVDGQIEFDVEATERCVSLAQGHPYMVHLIGKYALRQAFSDNRPTIRPSDIDQTLKGIAERAADPVLEGRYKKAVGSSAQREAVLKALAEKQRDDGEVWTTDAYKLALDKGVDNASQYVGQLVTTEYGQEIEKVRERFYRFKDSLFAAYVRARPSLLQFDG